MSKQYKTTCMAAVVYVLAAFGVSAGAQELGVDAVAEATSQLAEYRAIWAKRDFEYAMSLSSKNENDPAEVYHRTYLHKAGGKHELLESGRSLGPSMGIRTEVYAKNDRYQFALQGTGESTWNLTHLEKLPADAMLNLALFSTFAGTGGVEFPAFQPLDLFYTKDAGFVLKRAAKTVEDGNELVQLELVKSVDADMKVTIDGRKFHTPGTWAVILILDPQMFWLPRSATVKTTMTLPEPARESSSETQCAWNYNVLDGVPHVASFNSRGQWSRQDGTQGSWEQNCDEITYQFDRIPRSRFSLSFYGFDEPFGTSRQWWLFTSLLGAAMILAGIVVWKRRTTRQSKH